MGMSVWQAKRQLAWLPTQASWIEAPAGLVFTGGGFVSEDLEGAFSPGAFLIDGPATKTGTALTGVTPFCRVSCTGVEWDAHSSLPRIERANFSLWSTAGGAGVNGPGNVAAAGFDSHGINQVTGQNRSTTAGQGKSQGRDVDELIGRFLEYVGTSHLVDSVHGFQGMFAMTSRMETVDGVAILTRALDVELFNVTASNYYHPATAMTATKSGSNAVLAWRSPPARYDAALGVIRRGTASGDAAPTDPTSGGTLISSTVPVGATGYTDIPGSGVWNYSYWPAYAETPTGTVDRYPSRATAGVTV